MAFLKRCLLVITRKPVISIKSQTQHIHRWVAPTLKELKRREKRLGGKVENPRNTFLEWNLEAELFAFGKRLQEDFDPDLLLQAFTDRSYVIKEEMKQKEIDIDLKMKDNRDLAKEGEKFLNHYIHLYLTTALPKFPQEGINSICEHLTSDNVLSNISFHIGTKDIILAAEYPVDSTSLTQTFKALVGALILSSGEQRASYFVRDFVVTQLQGKDINEYWEMQDPWTMLNDILSKSGDEVEPRLIGEVGSNTLLACYRVGLYVNKKMISAGFGENIAEAKKMAAHEALKKIFNTEDHMKPINFKLEVIPKSDSQERYQISSS